MPAGQQFQQVFLGEKVHGLPILLQDTVLLKLAPLVLSISIAFMGKRDISLSEL
jgi:hypothetical protein